LHVRPLLQEFEEQPCLTCGSSDHRQWECPNKALEVYRLPDQMQGVVNEQYQRDIARVHVSAAHQPC
jgi:translation initiation factor RLI1